MGCGFILHTLRYICEGQSRCQKVDRFASVACRSVGAGSMERLQTRLSRPWPGSQALTMQLEILAVSVVITAASSSIPTGDPGQWRSTASIAGHI